MTDAEKILVTDLLLDMLNDGVDVRFTRETEGECSVIWVSAMGTLLAAKDAEGALTAFYNAFCDVSNESQEAANCHRAIKTRSNRAAIFREKQ